jgi:hypothetical protein
MNIDMPAPLLEFAFRITADLGPIQELGSFDGARRRIIPIVGGTVAGPRLNGLVMTGGADWQAVAADGTAHAHARYWLQAGDGSVIGVENVGIRHGPRDVLERLFADEAVNPKEYYFRSTPSFAATGYHAWLSRTIFVCTGARTRNQVILDTYALT